MSLRDLVEREAIEARRASAELTDARVHDALRLAAGRVRARAKDILRVNGRDYARSQSKLDAGTLDRLRLDDSRVDAIAVQLEATADAPPLERELGSRTLANGLRVSEHLVPIGVVGANFEARPNVTIDIAAQLLKSLNGAVLRTGGAALATATFLVDEILRPALEEAELPPRAVGIVRSRSRGGARTLCSLPKLVPLVILRGSGPSTAALVKHAAANGVRTLAHAEGGGVLYVHASASPELALRIAEASLDRLGVCNRLNLALVDARAVAILPRLVELFAEKGLEAYGTARAAAHASLRPLEQPLGHEWASDPEHVAAVTVDVVDDLDDAVRIANEETSGLAAGIVAEDGDAAARFLATYRGSVAAWHATTRFADGFELTGSPETGINVDWVPGPRGPVTYRDLALRQYRIVGDGTQTR